MDGWVGKFDIHTVITRTSTLPSEATKTARVYKGFNEYDVYQLINYETINQLDLVRLVDRNNKDNEDNG